MAKGKQSGFNSGSPRVNKQVQKQQNKEGRSQDPTQSSNVNRTRGHSLIGGLAMAGAKYVGGRLVRALKPVAIQGGQEILNRGEEVVVQGAQNLVNWVKGDNSGGNNPGNDTSISRTGIPAPSATSSGSDGGSRVTVGVNNRGVDIDLTRNSASNLGFGISKINKTPIVFNSMAETAYYENPNRVQAEVTDNVPNYSRTLFKVISFDLMEGTDNTPIMDVIYTSYLQEMLSNTNGGNSTVSGTMTRNNFGQYLGEIYYLYMTYVELTSLMAWAGEGAIPNKVMRKVAGTLSGITDMLILRNKMATALQNHVLPKPLVEYGQWLLQTYRSNDHAYSIDQRLVSPDMMKFLIGGTTSTYVTAMNVLINSINTNTSYPTLAALLISKTTGSWRWLDTFKDPLSCSTFDRAFNDIFNNLAMTTATNNGLSQVYYPTQLAAGSNDTAPACFECPIGMLPIHSTECLAHRWEGSHPVAFLKSSLPAGSNNFAIDTFTGYDITSGTGYSFKPVNTPREQIGNSIIRIWKNDASAAEQPACDYQIAPRGDQVFLFDVSYQQVLLSKTRFAEMMFN